MGARLQEIPVLHSSSLFDQECEARRFPGRAERGPRCVRENESGREASPRRAKGLYKRLWRHLAFDKRPLLSRPLRIVRLEDKAAARSSVPPSSMHQRVRFLLQGGRLGERYPKAFFERSGQDGQHYENQCHGWLPAKLAGNR